LGVLPGIIGVIQATEASKLIAVVGEPLIGRFLIYDALKMRFRELKLRKDRDCAVCGTHPTVTRLIDYEQFCGNLPEPQIAEPAQVLDGGWWEDSGGWGGSCHDPHLPPTTTDTKRAGIE